MVLAERASRSSRTREQTIHYSLHYVRLRLGPEPGNRMRATVAGASPATRSR
jgi:hypothetical protein